MSTTPTGDAMSDSDPLTFKLDDDSNGSVRFCALSWFDGIRGEYAPMVTLGEDDARGLVAQLTAWLDAPRLAARKAPEVVAEIDGVRLLRTAFEWGVLWQDNEDDPDDGEIGWYPSEAEARDAFSTETETVECEACRRFVNHADADIDEDGIYTCPDGTGCNVETQAAEVTP